MGTDGLTILDPKKYIEGRNSKMQNAVFHGREGDEAFFKLFTESTFPKVRPTKR
jgi:hypothetical protein